MKRNPPQHLQNCQKNQTYRAHQVHNVCNKPTHGEDDSSEEKSVAEIEPTKENGGQNIGKENKLLMTNFQVKIENPNIEGLITIPWINKFSNSRLILEITKNYGEFMLISNQIKMRGQLMLFYNIWVVILQQRIQML